jgi:hypothetical protein
MEACWYLRLPGIGVADVMDGTMCSAHTPGDVKP